MGYHTGRSLSLPWQSLSTQTHRMPERDKALFKCPTQGVLEMGKLRPGKSCDLFISVTVPLIAVVDWDFPCGPELCSA